MRKQLGATHLVDAATLTGACTDRARSQVGTQYSSARPTVLGRGTVRAPPAGAVGEREVWPLPIDGDYPELLRSEIADIVNSTGRAAGAITAACFLREFVDGRPWAHLDIAGTAWAEDRKAYQQKGRHRRRRAPARGSTSSSLG